jgi:hypothetical protein
MPVQEKSSNSANRKGVRVGLGRDVPQTYKSSDESDWDTFLQDSLKKLTIKKQKFCLKTNTTQ